MIEENKIKDAEIIVADVIENNGKSKKDNLYIEKALILILGILIGIAVKTQALEKITIGFDDYLMTSYEQSYDLNRMEDEQIKKMIEEQQELENEVENQH